MFLDISVENFRSIKGMQTLSFEATKSTHLEDIYVVKRGEYRILKAVSIRGANASGKSNIIKVFPLLQRLFLSPVLSKSDTIEFDNFALDKEWKKRDTIIETNFICGEKKYQYRIVLNNIFVREEELKCKPFGARTAHTVFMRTTDDKARVSAVKWGEKYASANSRKLELNLMPNMTVFGSYQRTNVDLPWMKDIIDWFDDGQMPIITPNTRGLVDYTTKSIYDHKVAKSQILYLLKAADMGVDDFVVKKETQDLPKEFVEMVLKDDDAPEELKQKIQEDPTTTDYQVKLCHTGSDGIVPMDFDKESNGTQRYYSLSSVLAQLLQGKKFVAIDELDCRLHPDLYQHFINTFLVNKHDSQMVFTTHYREILNDRGQFRDDAVYLTEKSDMGATELYSLADFDTSIIRNSTNVLNAYKAGNLGAIPRLGGKYIVETNDNENYGEEN